MVTQLVRTHKPNATAQEMAVLNQKIRVYINLFDVTASQIDRCARVYDYQTHTTFWQVESESDPEQDYNVYWTPQTGYTCQCGSGKRGFSNVGHPSHVCKHVRWAVAAQVVQDNAFDLIALMIETEREREEINSLQRLNDYQELLEVAPTATMRATAERIINKILEQRRDVRLNPETGKWEEATSVAPQPDFSTLYTLTVGHYQKWLRKQIRANGRRSELGDARLAPVEAFVKEMTGLDYKLLASGAVEVYIGTERYEMLGPQDLGYYLYEDETGDLIIKAGKALDAALLVDSSAPLAAPHEQATGRGPAPLIATMIKDGQVVGLRPVA